MPAIEVAGRHGSYATQFWRTSPAWTAASAAFRSRADMRAAYSRKALDRRLVLPLDTHNWVRALEVLNAGYARLGRTPEHFQAVLRDMVRHHGPYADRAADAVATAKSSASASALAAAATGAAEILPAVDELRDRAYAGDIPANRSLWVTLVWAYCALDAPRSALDAMHLATRRFRFSTATMQHLATLLVPVLCRHAYLDEAVRLYEAYLRADGSSAAAGSGGVQRSAQAAVPRSRTDDAEARRWLAEAAARCGDVKRAQLYAGPAAADMQGEGGVDDDRACSGGAAARHTIHSLFHEADTVQVPQTTTPAGNASSRSGVQTARTAANAAHANPAGTASEAASTPLPAAASSLPPLHTLSAAAVRQLFRSICRDTASCSSSSRVPDALLCWAHLYGPVPGLGKHGAASPGAGARCSAVSPPTADVQELLNLLASHGRWQDVLGVFCGFFLPRPAAAYRNATPADLQPAGGASHGEGPAALPTSMTPALALDAVSLNLVFAALPVAATPLLVRITHTDARVPPTSQGLRGAGEGTHALELAASAVPVTVVRLLDDLLLLRDDMVLTDIVMAAVGPALLQVGQCDRAFELLARAPLMLAAAQHKAPAYESSAQHALKTQLVSLGYAAFALCTSPTRQHAMVRQLPHLFPREVVRRFALRGTGVEGAEMPCATLDGPVVAALSSASFEERHSTHNAPHAREATQASDATQSKSSAAAPSLLDLRWRAVHPSSRTAASPSPPRRAGRLESKRHPAASTDGTGAAILTARADDAMRRDFVRLHERRRDAFTGTHEDAERDPRPIPKGLHDHASGWDFFGRGGEMAFANHRRTPHPFTMQPKVMRSLRNPYRGWNPRQNSSLTHKENVIKWNGKSSV